MCYKYDLYETLVKTPKPFFILPNYLEDYNGIIESDYSDWLTSVGMNLTVDNYSSICLSNQDYELLDTFFANLFVRQPNSIEDIGELPSRDKSIKERFIELFEDEDISNSLSLAVAKIEFLDHGFRRSFAGFFEDELSNYQRTLLISDSANYITSDVPFILSMETHRNSKSSNIKQILIPLTPKCLFSYSHFFNKDKMLISDKTVERINKLFLEKRKADSKYVFACNKEEIERVLI